MVLKVLRFGTQKLFDSKSEVDEGMREYKIDQEALNLILDRDAQFMQLDEQAEEEKSQDDQGVFDYLSQFKVAELKNTGEKFDHKAEGIDLDKLVDENIFR